MAECYGWPYHVVCQREVELFPPIESIRDARLLNDFEMTFSSEDWRRRNEPISFDFPFFSICISLATIDTLCLHFVIIPDIATSICYRFVIRFWFVGFLFWWWWLYGKYRVYIVYENIYDNFDVVEIESKTTRRDRQSQIQIQSQMKKWRVEWLSFWWWLDFDGRENAYYMTRMPLFVCTHYAPCVCLVLVPALLILLLLFSFTLGWMNGYSGVCVCVYADCSSVFRIVPFDWNNEMRKYFRVYTVDTLCAMCI